MSTFKYKEGNIEIDLLELIDNLPEDEQEALLRHSLLKIAYNDAVAKAVIERLTDDPNPDCWWSSTDPELRFKMLCKIEDQLISGYNWYWLQWLRDAVKGLHNDKRLYYALYHDDQMGPLFRDWASKHGFPSHHHEDQDEKCQQIIKHFDDAIDGLKKGKEIKEPEPFECTTCTEGTGRCHNNDNPTDAWIDCPDCDGEGNPLPKTKEAESG